MSQRNAPRPTDPASNDIAHRRRPQWRKLRAARNGEARPLPWRRDDRDDDDEVPRDIDAFRYELARRIHVFISRRQGLWRTCREPGCRRHHDCASPRLMCRSAEPEEPDPTGERRAKVMADVRRALDVALAQRGAEEK